MRLGRFIAVSIAALSLIGCASPSAKVNQIQFGSTTALATTGNLRLVTERSRNGLPPIVCTEPSPDYAVAFGTKASAEGKLTTAANVGSEGKTLVETSEEVSYLGGRDAAVLALRDGLYSACQSYANGIIGHDAYAMILSQYGTLLVALVGDGDPASTTPAVRAAASRQATFSAMVVACISGHDTTRAVTVPSNGLLSTAFCERVLNAALQRALKS